MNELTPLKKEQAPAPIGVFDDFEDFQKALQMATALSKTQLIPSNFQNRPEDCLIAIDYSRRLGLPPTAVLPHLYVIGGRPSTSAQFMISLVNRSGQFSRIQWDESVDGEVEYQYNGAKRTIPNYRAVAWFEETSSGRRHNSPVVDVRFALKNGWLTKNDSKWQKMPEVMCRYRSASILIKSVCPELAMGMEVMEDMQDSIDVQPGRDVPRLTVPKEPEPIEAVVIEPAKAADVQEEEFYKLKDAIEIADSEALRKIGRQIADSGLAPQYLDELRSCFKARRAMIAFDNRLEKGQAAEKKEEKAPTRKKSVKAVSEPSRAKSEKELALERKMSTAANFTELSAALCDVESAIMANEILSASYDDFTTLYKERAAVLKSESKDAENELFATLEEDVNKAEGDKDQKNWAVELGKTILNQTDAAFIRTNMTTADEWRESGALTPALHAAVVKYARARIAAFF